MSPKHRLIAALPLAALAIAGCGGGSNPPPAAPAVTTTAAATLSKEALIAQGDAICAEVNAAVGTVSSGSTDSASRLAQEADLYGGMVQRLQDLGTPDDTAGYSEFISAADELAQAESDAQLASERGDESGLLAAQETASSALASFQAAAQAYGFEECAEAPSAPATSATTAPSGTEAAPQEAVEPAEEEGEAATPETEPAPETGGAGGTAEAAPPAAEGTGGGGTDGGSSGGIGPG